MRYAIVAVLGSAMALAATPASASLVYNANPPTTITAQGFGNVPRDLTIDGKSSTESGCVGVGAGGAINFGADSCIANAQVHDSNGVQNTGGDEPNPLKDDQKYGIPTVAELGWTSAADIGLLFNATEPGGNSITINDITLKFYNSTTGDLITAIDNGLPVTFDPSQQGNGSAGFVFTVDSTEQTWLNDNFFNVIAGFGGPGNVRIALESSLSDAAAGPESWVAFNLRAPPSGVPEPATWAMMLIGFGGMGLALRHGRRRSSTLMQIA